EKRIRSGCRCRTKDGDRRWGTASASATSAAALATPFPVSDEELCAGYWPDPHYSGACNCHSVSNFGSGLHVSAGAKINPRRCENIGASAIFAIPRQGHLNNAPICASVLREIGDLHEMIP